MTHDYKRSGTTTLFAASDVLTGSVIGREVVSGRVSLDVAIPRSLPTAW